MRRQILASIAALFILTRCDYSDSKLMIKNHSKKTIAIQPFEDTIINSSILSKVPYYETIRFYPNDSAYQFLPGKDAWKWETRNSKNKKLNIFVFDLDTLRKYNDMEFIRLNKMYKRYELTEKELNNSNWIIDIY
jgi:hypothetical protein